MIRNKALEIIANDKIEFEGSNEIRKEEYWNVANTKITIKDGKYWCTCKHCSMQSIPRGEESKCCFVEALKHKKKDKIFFVEDDILERKNEEKK